MLRAKLVLSAVLPLVLGSACITTFDVDAGLPPDGGNDGGVVADAGSTDAVVTGDATTGVDTRTTGTDAATGVDTHSPGTDAGTTGTDAGTTGTDAGTTGTDAYVPREDGGVSVGGHCENEACVDTTTCVGNSTEAYCRTICVRGGTDCDESSEYCIGLTLPDGGASPTGACVPAQGENASCVTEPCAEVYVCAYYGDAAARSCRVRCLPQDVDSGCPSGQDCLGFSGQDAGACL